MKAKYLLFAALLVAGFSACKKDSNSPASTADNTITWTADGKTFTSKAVTLALENDSYDSTYNIQAVSALDSTAATLEININFFGHKVVTGVYSDTTNDFTYITYVPKANGDYYISNRYDYSLINVTRVDGAYVEGTFTSKVSNPVSKVMFTITNGKFRINKATVTQIQVP